MDSNRIKNALSEKSFGKEQRSLTLNIITGFHLIDPKYHLFVLEGLRDDGIKRLCAEIARSRNDQNADVIYNSSMSFSERLYSSLDVEILKIKLFEPLEEIVRKPLLYVRDMTPKASFDALIKLNQLNSECYLRTIVRCDLLPSAAMVLSMSKEFGVPLNHSDLNPIQRPSDDEKTEESGKFVYEYTEDKYAIPHTSKTWTPIDNNNEKYVQERNEKINEAKNFVETNVEKVHEKSEKNKVNKPFKNYVIPEGFSYSSSTINPVEKELDRFREYIKENSSNVLYSYNPEYHHSMTFVPVNLKKLEDEERKRNKSKWRSREGWIYPDVKTSMECNKHTKQLDPASLDKLNESWDENALHAYKMKSPLDRGFWKEPSRNKDFDVWHKPKPDDIFPITIFEAGTTKENKEKETRNVEKEIWKSKVVVKNEEVKTHRMLASTEMKTAGAESSNQMEKTKGILKDEPSKKTLNFHGVNFNSVPSLFVLNEKYEEQDQRRLNYSKGFKAGDDPSFRITDDRNKIPVYDYERFKFKKLKGNDLNLLAQRKTPIHKRRPDQISFVEYEEISSGKSKTFTLSDEFSNKQPSLNTLETN